jgi:putative hydrolase of the HAD superfamily
MSSAPLALSLDLDNTLWDTPPVIERAERVLVEWLGAHAPRILEEHGVAGLQALRAVVAAEFPARCHDLSWVRTESLRRAARLTGYDESLAVRAFEVFLVARNEILPFEEVPQALTRLAARLPVYALTNGNACVHRVGLGAHFAGSVDAALAGAAKPDARIFGALIEMARIPPGMILHVGDDAHADVEGARAAGCRTVWMNRNQVPWPGPWARADHEVADLDGLVRLVERLLQDA